jgi:hypothetical protein
VQSVFDRILAETNRDSAYEKVTNLLKLPGFAGKTHRELLRMMLEHSVEIKHIHPREVLFAAGHTLDKVRKAVKSMPLRADLHMFRCSVMTSSGTPTQIEHRMIVEKSHIHASL